MALGFPKASVFLDTLPSGILLLSHVLLLGFLPVRKDSFCAAP